MSEGRLLAIGDVHGQAALLTELLAQVQPTAADEVVFLGDYIDRGTASWQVLKTVYALAQRLPRVTCLKGNHEVMFLSHFTGEPDVAQLLAVERAELFDWEDALPHLQQAAATEAPLLGEILRWLAGLPVHYQTRGVHFSHAGCSLSLPLAVQTADDFVWTRREFYEGYRGSELWVIGHTPVQHVTKEPGGPRPLTRENKVIMLDTGAFLPGGRLSCLDLISGKIWQAGKGTGEK